MKSRISFSMLPVVFTLAASAAGFGAPAQPQALGDPYPLKTCPVSGKELGSMGDIVVRVYSGREVRFCCEGCPPKFEAEREKYVAQIDKAIVEQQLPLYPSETCVVSGDKLGSMGEPLDCLIGNRLVRLCCKDCIEKLTADPSAYLRKLDDQVIGAQKAAYPLNTCVVSGDKLGAMGNPIEYVLGNRLYRLCCKGCIKTLRLDPAKYASLLDASPPPNATEEGKPVSKTPDGHAGHHH